MPRIVRGGLIQATSTHDGDAPLAEIKKAMIEKHIAMTEDAAKQGEMPVLLTSAGIRPYVRSIIERFRAQTPVLSQNEIHAHCRLKTVGTI